MLVHVDALGDDVVHLFAGIERGVRILKDDLGVLPEAKQLRAPPQRRDALSVELDAARRHLQQAHEHAARRGFAASALADKAEGFALADMEADVIDGGTIDVFLSIDMREVAVLNEMAFVHSALSLLPRISSGGSTFGARGSSSHVAA